MSDPPVGPARDAATKALRAEAARLTAEVARLAGEKAEPLLVLDDLRVEKFLDDARARMTARAEKRERPVRLPWPNVNEVLGGGLWPGLTVLCSATGAGKTQAALQVALHAAQYETPALYFALELGRVDLVARLMGLILDRKWSDLYLGKLREGETITDRADALDTAASMLRDLPLYIHEAAPGWNCAGMLSWARQLREKHPDPVGPPLVVLDFLQLVGGEARELRERIGAAAYAARMVARDCDAAVLLLSSIARDKTREKGELHEASEALRAGKEPPPPGTLVGLGKESGDIEHAADNVLVLVPGAYDETLKKTRYGVAAAKVRAGGAAWVANGLDFNGGSFNDPSKHRTPGLPK